MLEIESIIAQAHAETVAAPCGHGHHFWKTMGGRPCPKGDDNASQAVYQCERCGEEDYGDPGGPAYEDCKSCRCEGGEQS